MRYGWQEYLAEMWTYIDEDSGGIAGVIAQPMGTGGWLAFRVSPERGVEMLVAEDAAEAKAWVTDGGGGW